MMLMMSASIKQEDVTRLNEALANFKTYLRREEFGVMRYGAILICQSLRARTPKAKKVVKMSEVVPLPGGSVSKKGKKLPKYLTDKDGVKRRLFGVRRHSNNSSDTFLRQGYARTKGEMRKAHGTIKNEGLAKRSWGWFMHSLFSSGSIGKANPRATKLTSKLVVGHAYATGAQGADILIHNKLEYVAKLLGDGEVANAVEAASKKAEARFEQEMEKAQVRAGLK